MTTANQSALYQFATIQIVDLIRECGGTSYIRSFDRVIEEIFGYPKLGEKIGHCRTESSFRYVYRNFGESNLRIFRDSILYDALGDLVRMDHDLRRMQKAIRNDKENGRPNKELEKQYNKLTKFYRKTVDVVCRKLNIRGGSRFGRNTYKAAKNLVARSDDYDLWEDGFGVFDPDGDFYGIENPYGESVDYFEQFINGRRDNVDRQRNPNRYTPMQSDMFDRFVDDDDDDEALDFSLIDQLGYRDRRPEKMVYPKAYPKRPQQQGQDPQLVSVLEKLNSKLESIDTLSSLIVTDLQTRSKPKPKTVRRMQDGASNPAALFQDFAMRNPSMQVSRRSQFEEQLLPPGYSNPFVPRPDVPTQARPTMPEPDIPEDPEDLSPKELISMINGSNEPKAPLVETPMPSGEEVIDDSVTKG